MLFEALREQHWIERIAIFLTTVVLPILVELGFGLITIGWCGDCVNFPRGAVYFALFPIALAVIALASYVNWSKVKKRLDEESSQIEDSVSQLREEHELKITGIQVHSGDLQTWMTNMHLTLQEQYGIELPPYGVTAGGSGFHFSVPELPESGITSSPAKPPNWLTRLCFWFGRQLARFRDWLGKYIWKAP